MVTAPSSSRTSRWRLGAGAVVILVIAAFAITVAIGMLRGAGGAEAVPAAPSATPSPTGVAPAGVQYVHVAGAVGAPGLYTLPAGARVADAISAAGGFAPDAEQSAVNLAREVADGEQILVPVIGAAPVPAASAATDPAGALVDLNSADAALLDTLPGVGPAIAARIIAWRDENGGFTTVEDLLAVSGIGDAIFADLRDRVRV